MCDQSASDTPHPSNLLFETINYDSIPTEIQNNSKLQWRLYDRNGYIVFARGEMVISREQIESLLTKGLYRDTEAHPEVHEFGDLAEFKEITPVGIFPPPGIKPQIWERLQLRLLDENSPSYFSARLVGYIKNMSILVTRPTANFSYREVMSAHAPLRLVAFQLQITC